MNSDKNKDIAIDQVLGNVYSDYHDACERKIVGIKLSDLINIYNERRKYITDLLRDLNFRSYIGDGFELQVMELFENVRELLLEGNEELMCKCMESICAGKENVIRFMVDQNYCIDDSVKYVMNILLDEYSYHIKYLNHAINVLRDN